MRVALLSIAVILVIVTGAAALQFWENIRVTSQQAAIAAPPVSSMVPNASAADAPAISADNVASLAASLPSGMRAVSIATDATVGLAGHVAAGDHVDILFTHDGRAAKPAVTEVLLPNVRVLAVNTGGKNDALSSVTVEAGNTQVQKLFLAEKAGTLSLALRSPADKDDNGIAAPTTIGSLTQAQVTPQAAAAPEEETVRIIRGTGKQNSKE